MGVQGRGLTGCRGEGIIGLWLEHWAEAVYGLGQGTGSGKCRAHEVLGLRGSKFRASTAWEISVGLQAVR